VNGSAVDVNTLGENFQTLKRALGFSGGRDPYAPLATCLNRRQENLTEANARRMRPSTRPQLWHRSRGWGKKVEAEFKVTVTRLRLRMTPDLWSECKNLERGKFVLKSSSLAALHLHIIKCRCGIMVNVGVRRFGPWTKLGLPFVGPGYRWLSSARYFGM